MREKDEDRHSIWQWPEEYKYKLIKIYYKVSDGQFVKLFGVGRSA